MVLDGGGLLVEAPTRPIEALDGIGGTYTA